MTRPTPSKFGAIGLWSQPESSNIAVFREAGWSPVAIPAWHLFGYPGCLAFGLPTGRYSTCWSNEHPNLHQPVNCARNCRRPGPMSGRCCGLVQSATGSQGGHPGGDPPRRSTGPDPGAKAMIVRTKTGRKKSNVARRVHAGLDDLRRSVAVQHMPVGMVKLDQKPRELWESV